MPETVPAGRSVLFAYLQRIRPFLSQRLPDTRSFISLDTEFVLALSERDQLAIEVAAVHYWNGKRTDACRFVVNWKGWPGVDDAALDLAIRAHARPMDVNWRFQDLDHVATLGVSPDVAFQKLEEFLVFKSPAVLVAHNFLQAEASSLRASFARATRRRWKWQPDQIFDPGLTYFAAKHYAVARECGYEERERACLFRRTETMSGFYRRIRQLAALGCYWNLDACLRELQIPPPPRRHEAYLDALAEAKLAKLCFTELGLDQE